MGILRETRQVDRTVIVGATCDVCGTHINTFENLENLEDATQVTLEGWYGGVVDLMYPETAILCKDCTYSLIKQFFPKLLEPDEET